MAVVEQDDVSDGTAEKDIAGRHLAGMRDALKGRAEPDDDDDSVVVAQEPAEEDEEAEEIAATRSEKRAKRGQDRVTARERAAAAEAKAEAYREILERQPKAQQPAQQQGNPVAHIDARIHQANEQLEAVHDEWARGGYSKERAAWLKNRAESLEVEKVTAIQERREALMAPNRAREAQAAMLRARAPDVHDNPRALDYAKGEFQKRMARGEPDSIDTYDAVMQEAREVILGKRPRPDAAQKGRAMGMGAGARLSSAADAPVRISMPAGSALDKIARAAYPKDDPAVARQKWVNANGKQYLATKRG